MARKKNGISLKQAGNELCQDHVKMGLVSFWSTIDSVFFSFSLSLFDDGDSDLASQYCLLLVSKDNIYLHILIGIYQNKWLTNHTKHKNETQTVIYQYLF